jgi:general secretion pathway protein G
MIWNKTVSQAFLAGHGTQSGQVGMQTGMQGRIAAMKLNDWVSGLRNATAGKSSLNSTPSGKGNRRLAAKRRRAGFTLIEMLVVLAIIGLIMALVGPRVLNQLSSSREKAATLQIQAFSSALDIFFIDVGRYPTESEGLGALVSPPAGAAGWKGPYLRTGNVPTDPWGNPYRYSLNGRDYKIVTDGNS